MSVSMPVVDTWDGENRRIYLKQGVGSFHWIDDIYKEYRHWRKTIEAARTWKPLMQAAGNNPKGGGKYTPRYITLLDGTRIVPYDENVLIEVKGEAITDNADVDPDPFDTSARYQPLKLYITPPASELVVTSGGSGLSTEESNKLMGMTDIGAEGCPVTSTPTDQSSLADKLNWLVQYFKCKREITQTEEKLYASDGEAVIGTVQITKDATKFIKSEMV